MVKYLPGNEYPKNVFVIAIRNNSRQEKEGLNGKYTWQFIVK